MADLVNRDAVVDAVKRTLQREFGGFLAHDPYNPERFWTMQAEAVVEAMKPHLTGEPVGYAVATPLGRAAAVCATLDGAQHLRELLNADSEDGLRVVALVPIEDQP